MEAEPGDLADVGTSATKAQRQARTIDLPVDQSNRLVDLLVSEVLEYRSVALEAPPDGIEEPDALRRADGSSVYAIAGANRYTSQRILDAEQRILTTAGRHDGAAVDSSAVELALLETAANGTALDAGQAALVRQMCTSGARVELAIAPAGAGKTTAMHALTLAWTQAGGQVIGLAPSAAAAAVLADHTGIHADTLAKLTWCLQPDSTSPAGRSTSHPAHPGHRRRGGHGRHPYAGPPSATRLEPRSAGVRLIGDDQQLAAVGAGGVLRDIAPPHGALRLGRTASASPTPSKPSAPSPFATVARALWVLPRSAPRPRRRPRQPPRCLQLAPTRDLVADLNHEHVITVSAAPPQNKRSR